MTRTATAARPRLAVATLGIVTIVGYGVAYHSYGVLIDPIRTDTGWSAAALGAVFSAVLVISAIGALAGGRLVDRAGTRPAFLLAGTVVAATIAIASWQTQLVAFAIFYAAGCGLIAALTFYHVTQPAAIRGAPATPERAVVWLTILGAFSSPIFLPLTALLVTAGGWRDAIRIQAILAAITFLPAAAVSAPRSAQAPRKHGPTKPVGRVLIDAWPIAGVRPWTFAALISGAAVDILLVYQVPILIDAGLSIGAAATIGGVRGFAQLGGRLPLTPVLRRLGARPTLAVTFLAPAAGSPLLLIGDQLAAAIAYALLAGASIGAIYTLQGIYTHELVGPENLSLLMGGQQALFAAGGAVGPLVAGILIETGNHYTLVVIVVTLAFVTSALLMSVSGARGSPAALD